MPNDRGVGQYLPEEVATNTRTKYEAHNALEINDYLFGGLLSSGSLIQDIPAGGATDILFENDPNSDNYYNVKPTVITNGRATTQKFINVAVNARGTEVPVAQQRSDFPNNIGNTFVTVGADVDTTNARDFPERLCSTARDQGTEIHSESVLIAPGDNVCIIVNNIGNQDIDATVYLRISPMPANLIETMTDGPQG